MSIERMSFVNIAGKADNLDAVLLKCVESQCFHVESATKTLADLEDGFFQLNEENPYKDMLKKLVSIDFGKDFKLERSGTEKAEKDSLEQMSCYVSEMSAEFSRINEETAKLKEQIANSEQVLVQLEHLQGMDVDLERFFKCKHIHIRFGRLPSESYPKLAYYNDKTFIFVHYDQDDEYYWGVYFAPINKLKEADKIFNSLYFERIWVPDFITGTPEEELQKVKDQLKESKQKMIALDKERSELIKKQAGKLNAVFSRMKYLYDAFKLRVNAAVSGERFCLVGFIPEREAKSFKDMFKELSDISVNLKPPDTDGRIKVPVLLKNNRFTKPFSMFVEMYGLPAYNGFNPTSFVAITYTLLFGIMFGDLGQGLVLSLIGAIIYKKTHNALGAIITRIGFSSAFFGLIFGSVFGFENALDPLYKAIGLEHKPLEVMENTNLILAGAIAIGVSLIIISIIINIFISFRQKKYEEAIFANNGITGLVFFIALLCGLVCSLLLNKNILTPVYVIFLLVLPLIIMFLREPLGCMVSGKKFHIESMGDFIASNFFEVFEFLLGYATNTLSFVRIGGFIFSHAGMMSVVMLLSETASAGASPIVIIIGNIFVMGMEGLIVGIQVLRLEFYEIFSRFYEADGYAFEPVSVNYDTNIE